MGQRRVVWLAVLLFFFLGVGFVAWKMVLPKPQASFVNLQPAPDFTVNNQEGKPFTLSSMRGSRVVLVFYRGYW